MNEFLKTENKGMKQLELSKIANGNAKLCNCFEN